MFDAFFLFVMGGDWDISIEADHPTPPTHLEAASHPASTDTEAALPL